MSEQRWYLSYGFEDLLVLVREPFQLSITNYFKKKTNVSRMKELFLTSLISYNLTQHGQVIV